RHRMPQPFCMPSMASRGSTVPIHVPRSKHSWKRTSLRSTISTGYSKCCVNDDQRREQDFARQSAPRKRMIHRRPVALWIESELWNAEAGGPAYKFANPTPDLALASI